MTTDGRAYTVAGVAKLANVSARTLHHYDETNLLRPSGRSEAGCLALRPLPRARVPGYSLGVAGSSALSSGRLKHRMLYRELRAVLHARASSPGPAWVGT